MNFSKYHGCGNDFIVINEHQLIKKDYRELAKTVCHRHIGIGADGLIIVRENPLEMIYYNSDGSVATMCGNGIRCFTHYCYDHGLINQREIEVITLAGIMQVKIVKIEPFICEVNFGKPNYSTKALAMHVKQDVFLNEHLIADNVPVKVSSVFIGTIHTVLFVNKLKNVNVEKIGKAICNHPYFTKKTNVNIVELINEHQMRLITYERGVGITQACGSGAAACALIANRYHLSDSNVEIDVGLDKLIVRIEDEQAILIGKSKCVFTGNIEE